MQKFVSNYTYSRYKIGNIFEKIDLCNRSAIQIISVKSITKYFGLFLENSIWKKYYFGWFLKSKLNSRCPVIVVNIINESLLKINNLFCKFFVCIKLTSVFILFTFELTVQIYVVPIVKWKYNKTIKTKKKLSPHAFIFVNKICGTMYCTQIRYVYTGRLGKTRCHKRDKIWCNDLRIKWVEISRVKRFTTLFYKQLQSKKKSC